MSLASTIRGAVPILLGFGAVLAAADFASFANRVAKSTPAADASADAVVALTGGSGLRIAAGIDLVAAGQGQRLLISGVNDNVTLEELASRTGGAEETWECCVDIGYLAETTLGNAEETANWAREQGYDSLIIVTSNYHMPRSQMVLTDAMPNITLIPWPVKTSLDPANVWRDWPTFRGVLTEWAKWRVTGLN